MSGVRFWGGGLDQRRGGLEERGGWREGWKRGGVRGLEGWGVWFGGEGGLDEGEDAWFWRRG